MGNEVGDSVVVFEASLDDKGGASSDGVSVLGPNVG